MRGPWLVQTAPRLVIVAMVLISYWLAGCGVSRNIVDLTPPPNQPPLQELEKHLNYHDPDAGRPDYVRVR